MEYACFSQKIAHEVAMKFTKKRTQGNSTSLWQLNIPSIIHIKMTRNG